MFSKPAKGSKTPVQIEPLPLPAAAPADQIRKAPPRVASLISSDITIEGGVRLIRVEDMEEFERGFFLRRDQFAIPIEADETSKKPKIPKIGSAQP
jgi:hypothetical protein